MCPVSASWGLRRNKRRGSPSCSFASTKPALQQKEERKEWAAKIQVRQKVTRRESRRGGDRQVGPEPAGLI